MDPDIDPAETVDDSLIRAWSRACEEHDAFPKLRVLILRRCRKITRVSLVHLCSFPALVLLHIVGSKITANDEASARQRGWSCESGAALSQALLRDREQSRSWDIPIHASFRRAGGLLKDQGQCLGTVDSDNERPALNFRIGPTPREDLFSVSDLTGSVFLRIFPDEQATPKVDVSGPPIKKRRLQPRASNFKNFEDLLVGFDGL